MQKTPLSTILREEVLRAAVFGFSFFAILTLGFVGIANAANGGLFGDILNKILASGNWESPGDGTVKNALTLSGQNVNTFVKLGVNRSCAAPQCVYGFDNAGNALCR